ncbi:MAG: helix-turn-helix domain-containing protein [Thermoanaerobaculia bacterium]
MKPHEVRSRRVELGLTVRELAFAINVQEEEIRRIEAGESDLCRCREFEDAFDEFEERVFGTFAGA